MTDSVPADAHSPSQGRENLQAWIKIKSRSESPGRLLQKLKKNYLDGAGVEGRAAGAPGLAPAAGTFTFSFLATNGKISSAGGATSRAPFSKT